VTTIADVYCRKCECGAHRDGGLPSDLIGRWDRQHAGHAMRVIFTDGEVQELKGETLWTTDE